MTVVFKPTSSVSKSTQTQTVKLDFYSYLALYGRRITAHETDNVGESEQLMYLVPSGKTFFLINISGIFRSVPADDANGAQIYIVSGAATDPPDGRNTLLTIRCPSSTLDGVNNGQQTASFHPPLRLVEGEALYCDASAPGADTCSYRMFAFGYEIDSSLLNSF